MTIKTKNQVKKMIKGKIFKKIKLINNMKMKIIF